MTGARSRTSTLRLAPKVPRGVLMTAGRSHCDGSGPRSAASGSFGRETGTFNVERRDRFDGDMDRRYLLVRPRRDVSTRPPRKRVGRTAQASALVRRQAAGAAKVCEISAASPVTSRPTLSPSSSQKFSKATSFTTIGGVAMRVFDPAAVTRCCVLR
jgi:hypothetical protein